jgi:hypothetical protein
MDGSAVITTPQRHHRAHHCTSAIFLMRLGSGEKRPCVANVEK